jgi:ABC-type transport system substrate-binding protein
MGRIILVLESANSDLPTILGISQFQIVRDGTRDFRHPVGTGPMRMVEFAPGVRSLAVRWPDYWRRRCGWRDRTLLHFGRQRADQCAAVGRCRPDPRD